MRDCRETWVVCSDFFDIFLSLFGEFSVILSKVLIYSSDHGNAFCTDLKLIYARPEKIFLPHFSV